MNNETDPIRIRGMFISNYGAESVKIIKEDNLVKHYEVTYTFSDSQQATMMEEQWSNCSSHEHRDGIIEVNLVIRPDQLAEFIEIFMDFLGAPALKEPSIILRFPAQSYKAMLHSAVSRVLRPSDRVKVTNNELIIILEHCSCIEPVQRRIRSILETVPFTKCGVEMKVVNGE